MTTTTYEVLAPVCPRCRGRRHLPTLPCWGGRMVRRHLLAVLAAYGDECCHCHLPGCNSVEHLVPRSRGGLDTLANTRPAHRVCNQERGVHMMVRPSRAATHSPRVAALLGTSTPRPLARWVALILGPPGAGKTTYGRTYAALHGLTLYDRDDWTSDQAYLAGVGAACTPPTARVAVLRTGTTPLGRARILETTAPTHVVVLEVPRATCVHRVRARGRPDLEHQLHGIDAWFATPPTTDELEAWQRAGLAVSLDGASW